MKDLTPRLAGVELYFEDLECAQRFYRETVGLRLGEREAGHHAKFDLGGGFLCLEQKGVESYPSADKAVVFIEVPDLNRAMERIGAERMVARDPAASPRWAVVHDPEGHNILLMEKPRAAGS